MCAPRLAAVALSMLVLGVTLVGPPATSAPDRTDAAEAGRRELVAERTESTTTFQNPDGTLTREISTEPIRFRDDEGEWKKVDLTLTQTEVGTWAPRSAPLDIEFSGGGNVPFVDLDRGSRDLEFGWARKLPEPVASANTLTYKDAVDGGDLVATALPAGFSYSVVLRERPVDPNVSFKVPVQLNGADLAENARGQLSISAAGAPALTAPAPVMWDSSAEQDLGGVPADVAPIDVKVKPGSGDVESVVLRPDPRVLADPATEYPVTIDPTFTIDSPVGDAFVQNVGSYTSAAAVADWPTWRVGTQDSGEHVARAFLRFPKLNLDAMDISNVQLKARIVKSNSCANGASVAQRITSSWAPGSLTWAGQPSVDPELSNQAFLPYGGPAGSTCAAHGWASWDVTSMVLQWQVGEPQYGFRIKAASENFNGAYREARSMDLYDTVSTYHPKLVITYTSTPELQALRQAAIDLAGGTATEEQKQALIADGMGGTLVDNTVPPLVEIVDDVDSSPGPGQKDGLVGQAPDCEEVIDPGCVQGAGDPTDQPGAAERVPDGGIAVSGCPSGQTAKRYTVVLRHRSLLRSTIYRYGHRVHYCIAGGKVTKWRARYDFLQSASFPVKWRDQILNVYTRLSSPASTAESTYQRHIELCVIKYGCYADIYPWSRLKVTGTGGKSYKGKAAA